MARRSTPKQTMTPAQLANLAKGNPRVAQRQAAGAYDGRVQDPSAPAPRTAHRRSKPPVASREQETSLVEELIEEISADPQLGMQLADALEDARYANEDAGADISVEAGHRSAAAAPVAARHTEPPKRGFLYGLGGGV